MPNFWVFCFTLRWLSTAPAVEISKYFCVRSGWLMMKETNWLREISLSLKIWDWKDGQVWFTVFPLFLFHENWYPPRSEQLILKRQRKILRICKFKSICFAPVHIHVSNEHENVRSFRFCIPVECRSQGSARTNDRLRIKLWYFLEENFCVLGVGFSSTGFKGQSGFGFSSFEEFIPAKTRSVRFQLSAGVKQDKSCFKQPGTILL